MKVKIIKCSTPNSWYGGLIGRTFKVADNYHGKTDYVLDEDYNHVNSYRIPWRHLEKDDCKVIDETK